MTRALVAVALGAIAFAACAPVDRRPLPANAQACIDLSRVAGRRVLPPNSVMFETTGPFVYRNDFVGTCPGLARLGQSGVIAIDPASNSGGQLCSGDRIRVFDPVESRATGVGSNPACVLGPFIAVPRR